MSDDDARPLAPADVTVIVLNWRRGEETAACVASLRAANLGGAGILVVDNGSGDDSVAVLRDRCPGVEVLELPENRGFAGGNNAGIAHALAAGARAVLVLNNDTEVAPDFLAPLVRVLNDSPEAAGVCAAVFRMDRPEMLDVAYSTVDFGQRHAVHIRGVNALPSEGFADRMEVPVAIGCCLLMRGRALREIGPFDEAYFAYHEDVDWCLRARRAGWRLFYEPFSRVFHEGSGTTTRLRERPEDAALEVDALPNAEPLPWNPVRTYLGARNLVRLLGRYANKKDRLRFTRACVTELPLELAAVVMGRAGWLRLGRFSYRDMLRLYFVERRPRVRATQGAGRALALAVTVPIDVCWSMPRDVWRAYRAGRLDELVEYGRGLRDGLLGRPLPLARLGLTAPVPAGR